MGEEKEADINSDKCSMKKHVGALRATVAPMVLVWARAEKDHKPAELIMALPMCRACAESSTVEDLISEEGRKQIDRAAILGGAMPPNWSTAEVQWRSLSGVRKLPWS